MNPSTHAVSPLRQRMIEDMRLRKLNGKTQIAYVRAVQRLAGFLRRSPDTATGEDLRWRDATEPRHARQCACAQRFQCMSSRYRGHGSSPNWSLMFSGLAA